jgi:hypothetical protein
LFTKHCEDFYMSIPTLLTVKQFNKKHSAFPIGGLRHQIFHENQNGMKATGVVLRSGRKVLLHEERYFLLEEIKNTGEYEVVIRLIEDADAKGKHLPLEDAVAVVRGGVHI